MQSSEPALQIEALSTIFWFWHSVFSSYIDQGKNPNLYTKDCLEKALVKNEQVKGKIDAVKVS